MPRKIYPNEIPAEVLKDLFELGPRPFCRKHGVSITTYYAWKKKYNLSASPKNSPKRYPKKMASKMTIEIEVGGTTMSIPLDEGGEVRIKFGRR